MAKLAPKVAPVVKKAPAVAPRPAVRPPAVSSEGVYESCRRKLDDYAKGLQTDKHALDDELIEQPERYFHVTELLAMVSSYRDEAKNTIAVVEAQADFSIRQGATEKLSEPQIKSLVAMQDSVTSANNRYNEWKLLASRVEGLRSSFESRGKNLGKLADLYSTNYFSQAAGGTARYEARERAVADVRRQSDI